MFAALTQSESMEADTHSTCPLEHSNNIQITKTKTGSVRYKAEPLTAVSRLNS